MVYIRADSNPMISGGHIMRCLAIADALVARNMKVCFLIADENSTPVLDDYGFPYINLESNWNDLLTDVDQVKAILIQERESILLIDSYQVTREYVEELKPFAKVVYLGSKMEYIGKLDMLINYSADIDYGFYNERYDDQTKLLLGPSYAPLRKEFQNVIPEYREQLEHILITTGNSDRDHIVSTIIKELLLIIRGTSIKLDIILGRMFEDKEMLLSTYDYNPYIMLHENVKSMSLLMRASDLAISANGTTVYELSAMGIPTLSFAMVEEQEKSARALAKLGVVDYCGRSYKDNDKCVKQIINRVVYYMTHNRERIQLAKTAHKLMDGNGASVIADAIIAL